MATKNIEEQKQRFLRAPLEEQKRILRTYGLKRGLLSTGLHSLQKRLGYRTNNNSKTSLNFLKAQERYFKHLLESESKIIELTWTNNRKILDNNRKILDFDGNTYSVVSNPKMKIYEWLIAVDHDSPYGYKPEVLKWALDTYFMQEPWVAQREAQRRRWEKEREDDVVHGSMTSALRAYYSGYGAQPEPVEMEEAKPTAPPEPVEVEEAKPTEPPPNFGPGEDRESDYGGGSRRKSQRRRRGRKVRRTRRH